MSAFASMNEAPAPVYAGPGAMPTDYTQSLESPDMTKASVGRAVGRNSSLSLAPTSTVSTPGEAEQIQKAIRSPIGRALRFQILRRDQHRCRYCGDEAPNVTLTVDHVLPVVLGGTNDPTNLVTACQPCNGGKAATPPDAAIVDDVAADALRWAQARTRAAAMFRLADEERDTKAELVIEHWEQMLAKNSRHPQAGYGSKDDAYGSIATWLDRGLEIEDIVRLIDQAVKWKIGRIPMNRMWAYLAGCCWNRIRAIEAEAQAMLEAEGEYEPTAEECGGCYMGCPNCENVNIEELGPRMALVTTPQAAIASETRSTE